MPRFGRSQVVRRRRRGDGFELVLSEEMRQVLRNLLGELEELLVGEPNDPSLRRLHPPAYLDDEDSDAAYQLLAGDELRTSRHEAIEAVVASLDADDLTEDDLWNWMQALNAVRLVAGTRLDVSEDDVEQGPTGPDDPEAPMWAVYGLMTFLQHEVVEALSR